MEAVVFCVHIYMKNKNSLVKVPLLPNRKKICFIKQKIGKNIKKNT